MAGTPAFPDGHFYSPVVDRERVAARRDRIWPASPTALGIDFDDASHLHVLDELFPRYIADYDYPEHPVDAAPQAFFTRNPQFTWLDPRLLFVLLRAWRPRRVIEVGGGYSTLLLADVNRRWFENAIDVTSIEPYPPAFLQTHLDGLTRLLRQDVQDVPLEAFASLRAGDVLFVDSSHVAKTGSDVNHLFFEVFPRLARGVHVHLHDIFLPHDYLPQWVIDEGRSWNEQYLLRALLMHSTAFRVEFGASYAFHAHRERVVRALAHPKGHGFAGGSFWIVRT